jgi:hypothetical protein
MCMLTNTYVQPYSLLLHFCVTNRMNTGTISVETLFFNLGANNTEF